MQLPWEVCSYLGISKSSFYYKAKHGGIPVIKQGKHLFVYRDELDKWLETGRKSQVPLSFEEEHEHCRNMEKTSCNIPTPEELRNYINESVISVTGTYEQSASVLMVDDSTIGTLGNFSASIGKAKSKKTFNVSAIAAAALKNATVLHYRACFPEGKRKILYVDTEQGKNHCQIVLNRILRLAGLPKDCDADNLTMLALRKYSPEVRLAITEEAIGMIPDLGLVIIDGIRDFIHDINSPGESTDVISKFMQWTDDRQIHIHTVLHQNKNDEHARGHVGTELNNKAETVMQIEPDKDDKSISVVEVIHSRDREFEPFAFRVNDDSRV